MVVTTINRSVAEAPLKLPQKPRLRMIMPRIRIGTDFMTMVLHWSIVVGTV